MLSLIGNAMGRELGPGKAVFLNALRNAGFSVDPIGDSKADEVEFLDDEEEFDELGEAAYVEEELAAVD